MKRTRLGSGFTIVEMLIVVVVVAILAVIVVVSYNGVTNKARDTAAKTDGISAVKQIDLERVQGTLSVESLHKYINYETNGATIQFKSSKGRYFCVNIVTQDDKEYHIDTAVSSTETQDGLCPDVYNTADTRCIVNNVYVYLKALNETGDTAIVTLVGDTEYGSSSSYTQEGSYKTIALNTRETSVEAGIGKMTVTDMTGKTQTSYHRYEAKDCS